MLETADIAKLSFVFISIAACLWESVVFYVFRYWLRLCFVLLLGSIFVHWGKSRCTAPNQLVYSGELVALDLFVKRPDIVHDIIGKSVSRFALVIFL